MKKIKVITSSPGLSGAGLIFDYLLDREDFVSPFKNFPDEDKLRLEHLILSYQGRKEWQSPVEPQTLEAILLHSINFIDSKINFMRRDES